MKTYQSVLPGATVIKCLTNERDLFDVPNQKSKLAELFTNGFWFCDRCETVCQRVEGEHGQPDHCDKCKSPLTPKNWNPPTWAASIGRAA